MSMSAIGQCVCIPFSGFGYPRFYHFCRDTGEYRRGRFLVTILDCHNSYHHRSSAMKQFFFEQL